MKQEYYKERIREGMLKRGEKPSEEKVERVLLDLEAIAELFVDLVLMQIREEKSKKQTSETR